MEEKGYELGPEGFLWGDKYSIETPKILKGSESTSNNQKPALYYADIEGRLRSLETLSSEIREETKGVPQSIAVINQKLDQIESDMVKDGTFREAKNELLTEIKDRPTKWGLLKGAAAFAATAVLVIGSIVGTTYYFVGSE